MFGRKNGDEKVWKKSVIPAAKRLKDLEHDLSALRADRKTLQGKLYDAETGGVQAELDKIREELQNVDAEIKWSEEFLDTVNERLDSAITEYIKHRKGTFKERRDAHNEAFKSAGIEAAKALALGVHMALQMNWSFAVRIREAIWHERSNLWGDEPLAFEKEFAEIYLAELKRLQSEKRFDFKQTQTQLTIESQTRGLGHSGHLRNRALNEVGFRREVEYGPML